jgi:hypothetical protein
MGFRLGMPMCRWLLAPALILVASLAAAADLVCTSTVETQRQRDQFKTLFERFEAKSTECVVAILTGRISRGDGPRIVSQLSASPYLLYLDLDSPGGSLPDSFLIGKEVRRRNLFTFVPATGRCASACFFVWIAGIYRHAESNLLVHRFYFDDPQIRALDSIRLAEFYRTHTELIVSYLQEMEVGGEARRIAEMMLHVPPNAAILFERTSYPNSFGMVPSRDQWLRHRCGDEFANRSACAIEAILRERLSK